MQKDKENARKQVVAEIQAYVKEICPPGEWHRVTDDLKITMPRQRRAVAPASGK